MLRILKQQVYSVTFGMGGIRMETDVLTPASELLSALAGPVLGFCVFPFAAAFPRMVICACIQSVVNLLPVYPLDGGRAVESIIHLLIPKSAEKICRYFRILISVLAVTAAVYLTFICHSGVLPILCVGLILSKKEKFLANRSFRRYNNRKKLRGCYERTDQKDPADCAETCTVYRRRI